MAKTLDDTVLDGALNILKNNTSQIAICNAQPLTYAQATVTFMLALKTGLSAADFTGPVNDTSGRKLNVNAIAGLSVTNSGTAIYAAWCSGSVLLAVTTIASQVLTAGNSITVPSHKVNMQDPT